MFSGLGVKGDMTSLAGCLATRLKLVGSDLGLELGAGLGVGLGVRYRTPFSLSSGNI